MACQKGIKHRLERACSAGNSVPPSWMTNFGNCICSIGRETERWSGRTVCLIGIMPQQRNFSFVFQALAMEQDTRWQFGYVTPQISRCCPGRQGELLFERVEKYHIMNFLLGNTEGPVLYNGHQFLLPSSSCQTYPQHPTQPVPSRTRAQRILQGYYVHSFSALFHKPHHNQDQVQQIHIKAR